MLTPMSRSAGFSLLEVLVTMVLLAFGLIGLAALESRMMVANSEAYQRSQAVAILADMSERLRANQNNLTGAIDPAYLTGTAWIGTGDGNTTTDCSGLAVGEPRDVCEWRNSLNGAAEANGTSKVGAMLGARGCIIQLQAPNPTPNICTPGIYGITVAWQGMTPTVAPPSSGLGACARGLYGSNDALRRAVSARIPVPLNQC